MNFDWSILYWIQDVLRCPALDFFFSKITVLGNSGIIWICVGIIMICTKKYRKSGIVLLCGLLVGLLVGNIFLKNTVARLRPCWLDESVQLIIPAPGEYYSFPSGHSLSSFISATILTKTDKRFGYVAIPLAVLIAFSRLYLFVHFPTDVLAGAVLGFIIGQLVPRVADRIGKKAEN